MRTRILSVFCLIFIAMGVVACNKTAPKKDYSADIISLFDEGQYEDAFRLMYTSNKYKDGYFCTQIMNDYIVPTFDSGNYYDAVCMYQKALVFCEDSSSFTQHDYACTLETLLALMDEDYESAYEILLEGKDSIKIEGLDRYCLRIKECFSSIEAGWIDFEELRAVEDTLFSQNIVKDKYFEKLENDMNNVIGTWNAAQYVFMDGAEMVDYKGIPSFTVEKKKLMVKDGILKQGQYEVHDGIMEYIYYAQVVKDGYHYLDKITLKYWKVPE